MNKIKVYISHSIRGIKAQDATHEDMVANNQRAIEFGTLLKLKFPSVDFYVPGDHDEFVIIAYEQDLITEEQILDIDCMVIESRDIVLNYIHDQYISNGMLRENMYAQAAGKTIRMAKNIDAAIKVLDAELERRKK